MAKLRIGGLMQIDGTATTTALRLIVVIAALAVLLLVALCRHRHSHTSGAEVDRPEPTEAEVRAAEESIREKTTEAVHRSERNTKRVALATLAALGTNVLFLQGMPLNAYFQPWGRVLTTGSAVLVLCTLVGCFGVFTTRRYKREMDKFPGSLHEGG